MVLIHLPQAHSGPIVNRHTHDQESFEKARRTCFCPQLIGQSVHRPCQEEQGESSIHTFHQACHSVYVRVRSGAFRRMRASRDCHKPIDARAIRVRLRIYIIL